MNPDTATRDELRAYCREHGIAGYSQLSKAELVEAVRATRRNRRQRRRRQSQDERAKRQEARILLIQAANRHVLTSSHRRHTPAWKPKLYGPKHIQQVVRIVRHHGLASHWVLRTAGFRS